MMPDMASTIALFGPPGCGKGTQAARLRELGFSTLATGDLLREARSAGSDLGRRAAGYMDRGELVPDDLIVEAVEAALEQLGDRPVVLDGLPRTVAQAMALARGLDAAILIDVTDDEVVERIAGRAQGRTDDDPGTVRERLRVYHRETEPLIGYYEGRGLLRRVDGTGGPDQVHEALLRGLRHRPA
jgi:adenylate kinase